MGANDFDEIGNLVLMGNAHKGMIDFVDRHCFADLDKFVFGNMFFDDGFDLWTNGRAKCRGLLYVFHMRSNSLDIADKSHIQHPIYFIENQILYLAEIDDFLIDEIEQSSWGSYDDIWFSEERFFLDERTRTTIHTRSIDSVIFGQLDDFFADLIDEFSGRSHDERLQSSLVGIDFLEQRYEKSRSFSSSCL